MVIPKDIPKGEELIEDVPRKLGSLCVWERKVRFANRGSRPQKVDER